jgi:hypothetical protein
MQTSQRCNPKKEKGLVRPLHATKERYRSLKKKETYKKKKADIKEVLYERSK